MSTFVLCTSVSLRRRPGRIASSNAYRTIRSTPCRVLIDSWTATSWASPCGGSRRRPCRGPRSSRGRRPCRRRPRRGSARASRRPGYRTTGRRFTYWSSSNRIRSSRSRSRTPGRTRGSPTAPSRIASISPQPGELVVGQGLARSQEALAAEVELDEVDLEPVADGLEHLEGLADDLGTGAVATDHAEPVGRHGATAPSSCPLPFASSRARFTAAR